MLIPLQLHLKELKVRVGFFFLSFLLSLFVITYYNELFFFLGTFAFTYIGKKKFIATHVTELLFTSMYISVNIALVINFPYIYYHCRRFLTTSWYNSQLFLFSFLIIPSFAFFLACVLICYLFILPAAFSVLNSWEITLKYILEIQMEARIETYTYWTLQTAFFLSNITLIFFFILLYSYLLDNMLILHIYVRKYKKYFLVGLTFFTSSVLPPEGFVQLFFILILSLLVEVFFFFTCLLFAKNNV